MNLIYKIILNILLNYEFILQNNIKVKLNYFYSWVGFQQLGHEIFATKISQASQETLPGSVMRKQHLPSDNSKLNKYEQLGFQ